MKGAPTPATKQGYLFNEQLGRMTLHRFVATVECTLDPDRDEQGRVADGAAGEPAWQFIYECTESKENPVQRVWGFVPRPPSAFDETLAEGTEEGEGL